MVRSVLLGAASLALFLTASAPVSAQTTTTHAKHPDYHHAKHRKPKEVAEGRQITVHKATPSYLTLGPGAAEVGTGNNYVLDTFDQPSPIEGTFAGFRGRERINQFGVPGATLFRF
jgi:hypothetical protein